MHILLFNFFYKPNPDYQNMALGLRDRGHKVWLGHRSPEGDLQWLDGSTVIAKQAAPAKLSKAIQKTPLVSQMINRIAFFLFILRIRAFVRKCDPDIVQLNPGSLNFPWAIKLFMPRRIKFIFDIRHLNVGIRDDLIGRFKEWVLVQSWWLNCRFIFDHACFNHAHTAQILLGDGWRRWATVVPVGLHEQFFTLSPQMGSVDAKRPLTFIYVGAITRFRDLERVFEAVKLASKQTTQIQVVIIGPDKTDGYYHDLLQKMELESFIKIEPAVPYHEVPQLMASYDVGLAYIPDRKTWHYQPTIKVLEYRALGLPILSIDVPSHRELVKEGHNGLLVANTVASLSEGLVKYATDRSFWKQCYDNSQSMRQGLSINDVAKMYDEQVYQKLKGVSH